MATEAWPAAPADALWVPGSPACRSRCLAELDTHLDRATGVDGCSSPGHFSHWAPSLPKLPGSDLSLSTSFCQPPSLGTAWGSAMGHDTDIPPSRRTDRHTGDLSSPSPPCHQHPSLHSLQGPSGPVPCHPTLCMMALALGTLSAAQENGRKMVLRDCGCCLAAFLLENYRHEIGWGSLGSPRGSVWLLRAPGEMAALLLAALRPQPHTSGDIQGFQWTATRPCAQCPAVATGWDQQVLKGSQGESRDALVGLCGQQQRWGVTVEWACRSPASVVPVAGAGGRHHRR